MVSPAAATPALSPAAPETTDGREDGLDCDPFQPPTPDRQASLARLTRALRWASGFSLHFGVCNDREVRAEIITRLRQELPEGRVQEVELTRAIPSLLDHLHKVLDTPPPDVVLVFGLERWLPAGEAVEHSPFLFDLNQRRNSLAAAAPCALVLWIPEYLLTVLSRVAPDFFSVNSGIYRFPSPQSLPLTRSTWEVAGDDRGVANLTLEEKEHRVASLLETLRAHESQAEDRRDRGAEARVFLALGETLLLLARHAEARRYLQAALALFRQLGNRLGEARSEHGLGQLALREDDLAGAGRRMCGRGRCISSSGPARGKRTACRAWGT